MFPKIEGDAYVPAVVFRQDDLVGILIILLIVIAIILIVRSISRRP